MEQGRSSTPQAHGCQETEGRMKLCLYTIQDRKKTNVLALYASNTSNTSNIVIREGLRGSSHCLTLV
jgi:hypothetical protein